MDSKKIGSFIAELRKEKGMTQQELGDMLNVTNKAVSKWETGAGYPEITMIHDLAELLGITPTELLNGERDTLALPRENEGCAMISQPVKEKKTVSRFKGTSISLFILSTIFILASFICLLCDFILNKAFGWSLYPVGAMAVVWFTILAIMKVKKHKLEAIIVVFASTLTLYLFLIEHLVPIKGWVIPLAMPIAMSSIFAAYVVAALFIYTKINRLYVSAIIVALFGIIVNLVVQKAVFNFVGNSDFIYSFIVVLSSVIASIILVAIGFLLEQRK